MKAVVGNPFGELLVREQLAHCWRQFIEVSARQDDNILTERIGIRVEEMVEMLDEGQVVGLVLHDQIRKSRPRISTKHSQ